MKNIYPILPFKSDFQRSPKLKTRQFTNKFSLGELLAAYGSDKSTHHDYDEVYESLLLDRLETVETIVEIGIGTNNISIPQNMGINGKPGAALRAFRDWAPNCKIIGADVDWGCLFEDERITTVHINQLQTESFQELKSLISNGVDLVIIDGLHTPEADTNSLNQLLPYLKQNGMLVVEDIAPKPSVLLWPFAKLFLNSCFDSKLMKRKNGTLFIVKRVR